MKLAYMDLYRYWHAIEAFKIDVDISKGVNFNARIALREREFVNDHS